MFLPTEVRACIDALENAGFAAYAVGGCVRDSLLGLTPQDYDLCTAALPEDMQRLFAHRRLVLAGLKHGTVGVVTDSGVVEITTFRAEGDYTDSRHPGWVRFVTDIAQDLSRRDFTVNAMAYSPTRGFCDPFGGREDLKNRCLRTVGDSTARFTEDALRILRGVRFAVRYGLTPDTQTQAAMFALCPLLDCLARERVFEELNRLLPLVTAADLVRFAPVLARAIPELAPMLDFDQRNPHHTHDLFTHTALVVAGVPAQPRLRWAALLHDIGKPGSLTLDDAGIAHYYGHAKLSAQMADEVLHRLKAPTALREGVAGLIARHMTPLEADTHLLKRAMSKHGVEATLELLQLQAADIRGTGSREEPDWLSSRTALIDEILTQAPCLGLKDLAISGKDLLALGYTPGPALGRCLNDLLEQVLRGTLPNETQPLLDAALCRLQENADPVEEIFSGKFVK